MTDDTGADHDDQGRAGPGDEMAGGEEPAADQPVEGVGLIRASDIGTGLFVVTAVAAAIVPNPLDVASTFVALGLFLIGCVLMLLAFFIAVGRSRDELIGVGGLYFVAGCAPRAVQWRLMGALAVQSTVAVVTAAIRPFSPLAFGVLVPVYGLGTAGLWAARHGSFPPRQTLGGPGDTARSEQTVPDQTE